MMNLFRASRDKPSKQSVKKHVSGYLYEVLAKEYTRRNRYAIVTVAAEKYCLSV